MLLNDNPSIQDLKVYQTSLPAVNPTHGYNWLGLNLTYCSSIQGLITNHLQRKKVNIGTFYAWLQINENTLFLLKMKIFYNCMFPSFLYSCEAWGNLGNLKKEAPFGEQPSMPSWSSSVISDRKRKVQQVGFLPILPLPVTKYETAYTSLINFKNVLNQLTQSHIAVFCDEGVYRIAREITLQRPDEISAIVLCLGSFHMIKAFLACIGKYLSGNECRTIWTQKKVFGIDVVESVLSGSPYERSLDGICLLGECISRLQWVEFLRNDASKYINDNRGIKKCNIIEEEVSQS